jgi:hypothetical protein
MNTTRRDLNWEGDDIILKVTMGYADLINIGKRGSGLSSMFSTMKRCQHPSTDAFATREGKFSTDRVSRRRGELC